MKKLTTWWRAAVAARRSAALAEARGREAGGSGGARLARWLVLAAALCVGAMAQGEAWMGRGAAGGALALIAALGWRDARRDDSKWASKELAKEERRRAWRMAREAEALHQSAIIDEGLAKPAKPSGGPRRL